MIFYRPLNGVKHLHCMLDLSAAFDTVDHALLQKRLELRFDIVLKFGIDHIIINKQDVYSHLQCKKVHHMSAGMLCTTRISPRSFAVYLADMAVPWNINLLTFVSQML